MGAHRGMVWFGHLILYGKGRLIDAGLGGVETPPHERDGEGRTAARRAEGDLPNVGNGLGQVLPRRLATLANWRGKG